MRRIVALVAFASLASILPFAPTAATTLDYQGYGFETGGFPPSSPGDTLWIPVVVTAASQSLGIEFGTQELTGWIGPLVSSGAQDGGDAVQFFTFAPGRIDFYRDASRDHDFGVDPPNATVLSTFTNGTLCLSGDITDFVLFLDTDSNTGAYEGHVVFDSGACLGDLGAASAEGFTFGGVLTRLAIGDAVIAGYDMQIDGYLEAVKVPEGVCEADCFGLEDARLDFPKPRHRDRRGGRDDDDDDDDDDDATGGGNQSAAGALPGALPGGWGAAGSGGTGGTQGGDRDRDRDDDRDRDRHDKDRKFRIQGEFIPCDDLDDLDPKRVEVRVGIGAYSQTLPEGSIRPARRRECDDDVDGPCWVYSNSRGKQTITRFTMQFDEREGEWDFEVQGRGISRDVLITEGDLLDFVLAVDGQESVTQVQLVQKKEHLRFVRRRDTCGPGSHRHAAQGDPAAGEPGAEAPAGMSRGIVLAASPNPMRDGTTIVLRALGATAGVGADVRVRVYDVRGRQVRALYAGAAPAGESRFAWDGRDDHGNRVANGIYVVRLEGGPSPQSHKIVVAR